MEQIENDQRNLNNGDELKQDYLNITSIDERNVHERLDSLIEIQQILKEKMTSNHAEQSVHIDQSQLDTELARRLDGDVRFPLSTASSHQEESVIPSDRQRQVSTERNFESSEESHGFTEIEQMKTVSSDSSDSWTNIDEKHEVPPERHVHFDEEVHYESQRVTNLPVVSPKIVLNNPFRQEFESFETANVVKGQETMNVPVVSVTQNEERSSRFHGDIPVQRTSNSLELDASATRSEPAESVSRSDPVQDEDEDDFDAGATNRIQSGNGIDIPVNDDQSVGTVCCDQFQLVFVTKNSVTNEDELVFVSDFRDSSHSEHFELKSLQAENKQILDIGYSTKHSNFLILTESSLQIFDKKQKKFEELYSARGDTFKRLACNETQIYIAAGSKSGDKVIRLESNGRLSVEKSLQEILPQRLRRHPSSSSAEIIDIATNSNDNLVFTYRFDRRREVGICLFKLVSRTGDWACSKQLLLNECWQAEVRHTPRIEWSSTFRAFILIEFITGHLILLEDSGEIGGERRFLHKNTSASPVNISTSDQGYICTRYESLINIKKID